MPMSPRLLRPRATNVNIATDADARAYIDAVRAADGQYMEGGVQRAIDAFIIGCKADSVWTPIKAACILMGARTLSGALVPLVGSAPTNVNFVSGDYNRKTGLVGDGSTKYLNSGRASNVDPQNNKHHLVRVSDLATVAGLLNGAQVGGATGQSGIAVTAGLENTFRVNNSAAANLAQSTGVLGVSRSSSSVISIRRGGVTTTDNRTSETPVSEVIGIFARTTGASYSDARMSFYSIGESLNLALLDTRVSNLLTAIGAAIP